MDSRKAKKQLKELEKLARKEDAKNVIANPDPTPTSSIRFDWINKTLVKEEVLYEYLCFLTTFPDFLETEKEKIIQMVRCELKIPEIEKSLSNLKFENLVGPREKNHILEHLSTKLGQSLK